jgi:hypothetical protein
MASYFVASVPSPDGAHAIHDRSRCPPASFPRDEAIEYLGEFLHPAQAMAVARLRYARVRGCACCAPAEAPAVRAASALHLRS